MCGIIATITNNVIATGLDDFVRDGLIASQVRGLHSTGLFQLRSDFKSYRLSKRAMPASDFINIKDAGEIISDATRYPLTVGHVRHATVGARTDVNAHPFVAVKGKRRVIGVHNGTLQGWRNKEGGSSKAVDSDWAFHRFVEEGPIDAFEYFNGAYAFVWHDSDYPEHVFMARNDERPLHFFTAADNKTILVASELGMLGWLADRSGFPKSQVKDSKQFFYLKPDKVYKFSLTDVGAYEELDRPKYDPSTTIQTIANPPVVVYPYRNSGQYQSVPWRDQPSDDWDEYNWYGRRRGYQTTYRSGQAEVLDKVKEALKQARQERDEELSAATVVTEEDLDARMQSGIAEGIKKAIDTWQDTHFDAWGLCGERLVVESPNTRTATKEEIQKAVKLKVFGVAVAFTGVLYDPDTSETWGECYTKVEPGVSSIGKYDCIVRGLSGAAAAVQFIEQSQPVPVVVVGVTEGIQKDEICFVVSPLSKEARQTLQQKMKASSSRVN